jgi:hypothetical protein
MSTLMIVIIALATQTGVLPCQCTKASKHDHTNWEGVYHLSREDITTNVIRGKVLTPVGTPLEGVLVEVFDHPERTLEFHFDDRGRKRFAACFSDKEGLFCFNKLPPGEYELRLSMSTFSTYSLIGIKIVKDKTLAAPVITVSLPLAL